VIRIDHEYRPQLTLDPGKSDRLVLDAYETATGAELAPILEGKPDLTRLSEIDLEGLARRFRMQKIIFSSASEVYDLMKPTWKGNREYLLAQVIRLTERFIEGGGVVVDPPMFNQEGLPHRHHFEHDQGGPPCLEGAAIREHAFAGSDFRHGTANPLHQRHAAVVNK
jgi:type III restriction enzyme